MSNAPLNEVMEENKALEDFWYNATTQFDHDSTLMILNQFATDSNIQPGDWLESAVRVLRARYWALQRQINQQIESRGFIVNQTLHNEINEFGQLVADFAEGGGKK